MKKVLFFVSCALFVAAMSVSCGNKNAEAPVDSTATEAVEEVAPVTTEETATTEATVDNSAMIAAAKEAGRAKCECYKKDAASVENCIRSIISAKYAEYQGNEEFINAMNAEYNACLTEKVKGAAKEAGDAAVKEGAKAISNALNKKK